MGALVAVARLCARPAAGHVVEVACADAGADRVFGVFSGAAVGLDGGCAGRGGGGLDGAGAALLSGGAAAASGDGAHARAGAHQCAQPAPAPLSISDDPFAGDAAIERFAGLFYRLPTLAAVMCARRRSACRPSAILLFHDRFADTLWCRDWLLHGLPAGFACTLAGRIPPALQSLSPAPAMCRVCIAWLSTHSTAAAPPPGWAARRRL